MKPIKLAIVEDQDAIRESLMFLLHSSEEVDLVQAFSNGEEAVDFLSRHTVDVALFDINLPGISGIEAIARLKAKQPATQFMVLSLYDDPDYIFKALRAGATGYILKNTPTDKHQRTARRRFADEQPDSPQSGYRIFHLQSQNNFLRGAKPQGK
jgi:DNA-binding NarL/FixJ family response regulator